MNIEKVKEIKARLQEAIEYCARELEKDLFQKSLALINELESENEWLVGKVKEKINEMVTYTVNNQKLKERIAELEKENANCLKQFAERLKEKGKKAKYIRKDNQFDLLEYFDDIDEVLEEFINKGDDKDNG